MSISSARITNSDIASHGIVGKPNKLPGPAASNKQAFDELVREVVAAKLNHLVDQLLSADAASQLGVDNTVLQMGAQSIQEALEMLQAAITTGSLPPGGVHRDDIADGEVVASKLGSDVNYAAVGLTAAQVMPIYVTTTAPTSASSDGIYLVCEE